MQTPVRSALLLLLTSAIWGIAFVAQSVGADYVETFTFLALRSWLAGFALLPLIAWTKRKRRGYIQSHGSIRKKLLFFGGFLCGFFLFTASALQQAGVALTTTAKAGFITAMYIIIVPFIGYFLGKRISLNVFISLFIAIYGLYLLCIKDTFILEKGDFFMLLCAAIFSFHILAVDHFSPKVDCIQLSCIQFFVTAILSTSAMLAFEHPAWDTICLAGQSILYAGLISSGVGYTLQIIGQKGLSPALASLIMSLESVFSAIAGWIFLHQKMSHQEILGCTLMFIAITIAQLPQRSKARP